MASKARRYLAREAPVTYAEACAEYERDVMVWDGDVRMRAHSGKVLVQVPGGFLCRGDGTGHNDPVIRRRHGNDWTWRAGRQVQLHESVRRGNGTFRTSEMPC